jgi:acid phosphatase family membrane protein YuiD
MGGLSLYIGTIAIAWFVAQGLKYVISSIKNRSFTESLNQLYLSGNMPSAHSATVVALTFVIGATDGVNSAVFGLASLFSEIVMYDAMMVRRSSGEQGKAIIQLIEASKSKIMIPGVAKGHTPMEVLAGAIVGSLVGLIVVLVTS